MDKGKDKDKQGQRPVLGGQWTEQDRARLMKSEEAQKALLLLRDEVVAVERDIASMAYPASRDLQGRMVSAAEKREASVYMRGRLDALFEVSVELFGGDR